MAGVGGTGRPVCGKRGSSFLLPGFIHLRIVFLLFHGIKLLQRRSAIISYGRERFLSVPYRFPLKYHTWSLVMEMNFVLKNTINILNCHSCFAVKLGRVFECSRSAFWRFHNYSEYRLIMVYLVVASVGVRDTWYPQDTYLCVYSAGRIILKPETSYFFAWDLSTIETYLGI